jgi:hypothetical protein
MWDDMCVKAKLSWAIAQMSSSWEEQREMSPTDDRTEGPTTSCPVYKGRKSRSFMAYSHDSATPVVYFAENFGVWNGMFPLYPVLVSTLGWPIGIGFRINRDSGIFMNNPPHKRNFRLSPTV